ncbi:MAG: PrgI family protein [Patescibacteria group bacterium]|nr:PrgI family protein [Patescibacteria group bacterium]
MQFVVPQFIDIEPKIIGPITPRQFILLIFAGGITFLCFKLLDFWIFVVVFLFVICPFFGSFTFVKINGRPFHYFLLNLIQFFQRPKVRVWRKEIIPEKEIVLKKEKEEAPPEIKKTLPRGRLSDLSILVDTGGLAREE